MGSAKNSDRRKRKYGENRKSITSANKTRKATKGQFRTDLLVARTQALIGQKVKIRTKEGPEIGVVQTIISRPEGAKRKGQYLHVMTPTGQFDRVRSRAKIIRSHSQPKGE